MRFLFIYGNGQQLGQSIYGNDCEKQKRQLKAGRTKEGSTKDDKSPVIMKNGFSSWLYWQSSQLQKI